MKKILLTALGMALLMSCSSSKSAAVDSALAEAKTLQSLAKDRGAEVPEEAGKLILLAEQQYKKSETEEALVLANGAVLQLQLSLLNLENKNMADSLEIANGSLTVIRKLHKEQKTLDK